MKAVSDCREQWTRALKAESLYRERERKRADVQSVMHVSDVQAGYVKPLLKRSKRWFHLRQQTFAVASTRAAQEVPCRQMSSRVKQFKLN